jgi:plastocyanin domain-containing protein
METTFLLMELGFVTFALAASWVGWRLVGGRELLIRVDRGWPRAILVRQGERLKLRLVRDSDGPCTREIVFPSLGIRRTLPVGKPVTVALRPEQVGTIEFTCGMNMLRGTLEVRAQR